LRRQWPGLSILPKLWDLFSYRLGGKKEIFVRAAVKKDESVGERSAVGEA